MKLHIALAVLIALLTITPVFAHDDGAAHPHDDKMQEAKAANPLSLIQKALDDSKIALEAKDLKPIHECTGKGMDALKDLLVTANPAPEKKERLEAAIKQMNGRLDALHEAADANDAAKTTSEIKKAEGAFKLLQLQVGK